MATLRRAAADGGRRGYAHLPHVIPTKKASIHLFAEPEEVEPAALRQLHAIAESGIAEHFVAAMPDVHLGKGAAVGSVYASSAFVAPNGVGVDIGCGMAAVPIRGLWRDDLEKSGAFVDAAHDLQRLVKGRIPTGFDMHAAPLEGTTEALEAIGRAHEPSEWLRSHIQGNHRRVRSQVGSLGGGNHFLEVVTDEDTGQVWLMLHSGSRWLGNTTAAHYNLVAMDQAKAEGRAEERPDLNGMNALRVDSSEGRRYLGDMLYCQAYALANRRAMLAVMEVCVSQVLGKAVDRDRLINTHHNFCALETCAVATPEGLVEKELWITRKGATAARPGQMGLIPGSMGSGSFVVEGRGDPRSWSSCSHGAGRALSRTTAFQVVPQDAFELAMRGILCDIDEKLRDEAPQAYKDLTKVMAQQAALVHVRHRLRPMINVKGIEKGQSRQKKRGEARRDGEARRNGGLDTDIPPIRRNHKKTTNKKGKRHS